jgi:hypothetical protein
VSALRAGFGSETPFPADRVPPRPEYLRELVAQMKEMQKQICAWCPNCEQHVGR